MDPMNSYREAIERVLTVYTKIPYEEAHGVCRRLIKNVGPVPNRPKDCRFTATGTIRFQTGRKSAG